jgi:hypothetical protein
MVLFDQIIEILDLPQFTRFSNASCHLEIMQRFGIRSVCVPVDHPWLRGMRGSKGFHKEAFGSFTISGRAQQEVERVSFRINGSIEVDPLLFDVDVRLVDLPGVRCCLDMRATTPLKLRSVLLDSAIDRRMIDVQTTLQQHLLQLAIAQRRADIPTDTQQNDVGLEMTPFERMLALLAHGGTSFPLTLPDQLFLCNTTKTGGKNVGTPNCQKKLRWMTRDKATNT